MSNNTISQLQVMIGELNRKIAESSSVEEKKELEAKKNALNEDLKGLIQQRNSGAEMPEDPMEGKVCDSCQ